MKNQSHGPGDKRLCSQCGAELRGSASEVLCPKCLLKGGLPSPDGTDKATQPLGGVPAASGTLQPGDQFGHYRIIRRIGGGGMGTVFEVEDQETGRRMALKVLNQALDSPEGRERFFREGRLAASLNHPNSVYVFGTEEIAGTPVIGMELVAGGTLEEMVQTTGPMKPALAVDAVLQMISGLEAAQRLGILHRDVKPSNCFVDDRGAIKIGDFGLSISTSLRTEPALTATGSFLGTPGFCSPEQLRGEELNVRSDIYSVGVTLFYLLTGRTPFETKNVVALIATVLEQPAPSPREYCPGLPQTLARAVQRCLQKDSGERFGSYDELRRALEPFSSAAPVPAGLVVRAAAGVVDTFAVAATTAAIVLLTSSNLVNLVSEMSRHPTKWIAMCMVGVAASILYYAVLEGVWGASLGKAVCRLKVVEPGKTPPGFVRALVRASVFVLVPILPFWLLFWNWQNYLSMSAVAQMVPSVLFYSTVALLFITARKKNGYAGVHELASNTRVICHVPLESRPRLQVSESVPVGVERTPRVGPYHIIETLEGGESESWLVGYDLQLLRKVWLHMVPPGTPPVPPVLRNLSRIGRLRWLTGRRSKEQNWDAFEALNGKALQQLVQEGPQTWTRVRFWLADLANELATAERDGSLCRTLGLDRVWITMEGRAKLLDYPAPGLKTKAPPQRQTPTAGNPTSAAQEFLGEVARAALEAPESSRATPGTVRVPLPIHARDFLNRLSSMHSMEAIALALAPLLRRNSDVTRGRRAAILVACLALPLVSIVAALIGFTFVQGWERRYPGLMDLHILLTQRWSMRFVHTPGPVPSDRQYSIYIASHYPHVVTNADAWSNMIALSLIKGEPRQFAERSVRDFPNPGPEEVREADAAISPTLPKTAIPDLTKHKSLPLLVFTSALAMYVCLPALIAAVAFRGGLILLATGVRVVRRDGAPASRLRVFWRGIVTWSPVWPAFVMALVCMDQTVGWRAIGLFTVVLLLPLISLSLPHRGLQDRLAGTWLVPV